MNRESGFYWVLYDEWNGPKWQIAEYDADESLWHFTGCELNYREGAMIEIDERKIERPC